MIAAILLIGCGSSHEPRTRVDFWAIGSEVEKIGELFDEFRRDNPDIEVRIQQIPWSAAHEKLLTAFAGDATPDLCQLGNTWIPEFATLGALEPLDRYVDVAIEAGTYDLDQLWTHDPELAKEMIEAEGYALNSAGYYEKDGVQLDMDISLHDAFIEKQRIAQVLVEQWQAIGVNATMRLEAGQTWGDNFDMGTFDVRMGWQTCDSVNEPWASMDRFNTRWLMPVGERASKNEWRWSGPQADAYSAIVDEIGVLPMGDPTIDDLFVEAMEIWFEELPVFPITQAKKIIPFDTTYWTGWPTYYDNQYIHPPTWWQHTHKIIHNLEPVPPQ